VEVVRGVLAGEVQGVISPSGGHGGDRLDTAEEAAATSAGPEAAAGRGDRRSAEAPAAGARGAGGGPEGAGAGSQAAG
jgi:hypothetical protein